MCQPWLHVKNAYHQCVAHFSTLHGDGSGEDVHARPPITLGDTGPDGANSVIHQQVWRIAGVMGDGLDFDGVAATYGESRRLVAIDVTPVDRVRRGRQMVMGTRTVGRYRCGDVQPVGGSHLFNSTGVR